MQKQPINTPLFHPYYPNLQRLRKDASVNRIENNAAINCKEFLATHGKPPKMVNGNFEINTDPGFVNFQYSDFCLRKDAEVVKKFPYFIKCLLNR